ncbi:MAG: DUF2680 domain-containing protein, partial [Sporomusa sp.]
MRKVTIMIMAALLVMSFTGLVFAAQAQTTSPGFGYGCCGNYSKNYSNLTDEQKAQISVWQQQMLEQRKQMLAQQVKWGWMTQAQADQRLSWIEDQMANDTYRSHRAMGMHAGNGYGCYGNYSQNYSNLTDEQKAQITVWQQQMLEQRKQMIARHVEWGWITQAQADERLSWIEEQMANDTYCGHGAMGMHAGNGHGRHGNGGGF